MPMAISTRAERSPDVKGPLLPKSATSGCSARAIAARNAALLGEDSTSAFTIIFKASRS